MEKSNKLSKRIETLDDAAVIATLGRLTKALEPVVGPPPITREVIKALQLEFAVEALRSSPLPLGGESARTALLLLAANPEYRPVVEAQLSDQANSGKFIVGEIALTTAVIIVLATSVDISYEDGPKGKKISVKIKKPNLSAEVGPLIKKLVALL